MKTISTIRERLVSLLTPLLVLAVAATAVAQNQTLYQTPGSPAWRDNYTGGTGCKFTVGSSNVVVSHLGYFSTNTLTGLATNHFVGLYNSSTKLLVQVVVPAGLGADAYVNKFYWMPLDPPVLLNSNTVYYVAAMPYNGDGDTWGDSFTATFNSFFVGTNAASTQQSVYGPGNNTWPVTTLSPFGSSSTYCIEGMANLPIDYARAGVQTTNVAISKGQTLSVMGFATGVQPISYQWWVAPNTPLVGQTNPVLTLANANTNNSGTYFMTATNALGGEQSPNVTVSVTAYPIVITQQPTNATVFANYPVSFSLTATGTPPISLQWSRNGAAIPGATSSNYSLYAQFPTNNGDIYSCLATNNIAPYTTNSSNATLTVLPNLAYPQEVLHGDKLGLNNNTYAGQQGGEFVVGGKPVLVTHLGYYAWPANRVTNGTIVTGTLTTDHHVGIYNATGIGIGSYVPVANLLGSVDVPAGSNPVTNGYMWAPLNPPIVLSANTTYLLVAETKSDAQWGDTYAVTDLNPYLASSCAAIYGGNGWGSTPYLGGGYGGQMYSAPNMAILALPTPTAYVSPTNVVQAAGSAMTLTAYAVGQAPVTLQWYNNGTPLVGQTNLTLFNPFLSATDAGNYYVIATNTLTALSATSAVATVSVTTTAPPETLFVGAHPTLSVSPAGNLSYQWFGNGTPIFGATNATYAYTVTAGSPTSFYCVATNLSGSATGAVSTVSIIAAPTAPYPAAVLAGNPLGYWRLNEADDGLSDGNPGAICHDYWGGNNGIYTNTTLGQSGYTANNSPNTDPTVTSAEFGVGAVSVNNDAYGIAGINFAAPTNTSVAFSIEAWVNANQQSKDAGIVTKGYGGGGEQFNLDTGGPTNAVQTSAHNFRFFVRDAAGGTHAVSSSIQPSGSWQHLVGVCDEVHSNVTLYINGAAVGSAAIAPGSGILAATSLMSIGSRASSLAALNTNVLDDQFFGNVNDVAIYNYALSASQVDSNYVQAGVLAGFVQAPPLTLTTNDGATITIPVTLVGTPPMGYYWLDQNQGTNVATGVTNGVLLNASLTVTVPLAWNGDSLQLVVTNAYGTTYATPVALNIYPATPQIAQDVQPQDVFIYQSAQFSPVASGTPPLSYRWTFDGSSIPGATNSSLTLNNVTSANAGNYQLIVTNKSGAATSSVAALTVELPAAGSYAAAVMGPNLLLYYTFSDVNNGAGVATNQGALGFAYNGTYEGSYSGVAGPTGVSNFGSGNLAVLLDGSTADVLIPPIPTLTVTNCTIAAWVYDGGGQPDNDAIFFHRQTAVFGLASGNNILGSADWVKYTWNGGSYDNYTGLVLPTNQWAFVAMVINPTNASIYLQNGQTMSSVSFAGTYPPAPFDGISYIGWDTANGAYSRRWNGAIDDVMVFNAALSPAAINALYAGVPPTVTLNLVQSGTNIVLTWPEGTLLQATNLVGPWVTNPATSPYTTAPTGAGLFYKVKVQ